MSDAFNLTYVEENIVNNASAIATSTTSAFVLNSAYFVFFMHCGFAMLSIGCVRARFAKHIAVLILADACVSAFGYYLFGYAFAYGNNENEDETDIQNPFIGSKYFALSGLSHGDYFLWVFQWTFAATACTIVSGAIAERAKFETYLLYSFFMAAWVYPVLTHSIWSTAGWAGMFRSGNTSLRYLLGVGAIDFAGSGAVHMVGGFAALTGCWVIGPRIGRFNADGTPNEMPGHNTSLFILGVMILWFGWYGFNPGSQLALIGADEPIANAAVTTTLSPAMAGLSAVFAKSFLGRKLNQGRWTYDVGIMGNGCLAGLVAITAGCSTVYPWGAVCIGIVAGFLYVFASWVNIKLHLDDPLDAIAVHAWNGAWGVLAVGFFAGKGLILASYGTDQYDNEFREYGCFLGGNGRLLGAQIIYGLWLIGWVCGNMLPFWFLLKFCGILRVPPEQEELGIDTSYHGGSAYIHDTGDLNGSAKPHMTNGGAGNYASAAELQALRNEFNTFRGGSPAKVV